MYKYIIRLLTDVYDTLLICQTKSPVSAGASSFAKKIDEYRKQIGA